MDIFHKIIREKPPKRPLYHYCSPSGMRRIIDDGCFSATHFLFFNDTLEGFHAVRVLERIIQDRLAGESNALRQHLLKSFLNVAKGATNLNHFVFCFSANGDLLSQWRGYCPSDGGYSVGFDAQVLLECAEREHFTLAPCIYEETLQVRLLNVLLDEALDRSDKEPPESMRPSPPMAEQSATVPSPVHEAITEVMAQIMATYEDQLRSSIEMIDLAVVEAMSIQAQLSPDEIKDVIREGMDEVIAHGFDSVMNDDDDDDNSEPRRSLSRYLMRSIARNGSWLSRHSSWFLASFELVALTFKHPTFAEEKEWRLISSPKKRDNPNIGFRTGTTIPFYKIQHTPDKEPAKVAHIIIGPTKEMERAAFSLKWYLESVGVHCPISKSEIPFRAW